MSNVRVHPLLAEIARVFSHAGKKAYLVGGAVRDMLRGKSASDWDIATDAEPEVVTWLFPRVIPTGIKHGTVTVLYKGKSIEVTTFRTESSYSDGRRPDAIAFARTIEEDLSRRDFTMNAIAVELPKGSLIDPFGGERDIRARIIRCVGDPAERFGEDGLRPLRAARFAAQLEFSLDPPTLRAIPGSLEKTALVAAERVRAELEKMLASERPSIAFRVMEKTGLLRLLFAELADCRDIQQKGFHRFDVLDHLLYCCDAVPSGHPIVRLAALLHDVGKPSALALDESGARTFHRHEESSARIAETFLNRFRFATATMKRVCHLVETHMYHYEPHWTDAAVRRLIAKIGLENIDDALMLRYADMWATTGERPPPEAVRPLRDRIEAVLAAGKALSIKDLDINGNDLASLGVPRGPRMGIILAELLETVLDDPTMNRKESLLEIARRMEAKRRISG